MPAAGYPVEWIESRGIARQGSRPLAQGTARARARRPPGTEGAAPPPSRRRARLRRIRFRSWRHRRLAHGRAARHSRAERGGGLTNRWLARVATRIAEGFPGSFPSGFQALYVGNPVRPEIAALPTPRQRFEARNGPIRLLVFGGSQGADGPQSIAARGDRAAAGIPAALGAAPERRARSRFDGGCVSRGRRAGRGARLHRRHGDALMRMPISSFRARAH